MKESTRMITGAIVIALGALVAITPRFLFSVCEYNGIFMQLGMGKTAHMPCYYTAIGSYIVGLLVALIGLTIMLAKERESVRMLSVILASCRSRSCATADRVSHLRESRRALQPRYQTDADRPRYRHGDDRRFPGLLFTQTAGIHVGSHRPNNLTAVQLERLQAQLQKKFDGG